MPSIFFSNPGHMDILAATTLGVNAKTNDSPIGYFGTGLKYAIATLLRHNHEIVISIGDTYYTFFSTPMKSRNKSYYLVEMRINGDERRPLGFTTDLGKNWGIREAYRELYSNMLDEDGHFDTRHAEGEYTTIEVRGPEFYAFHPKRDNPTEGIILPDAIKDRLLFENDTVQIYASPGAQFYYRGFATLKLDTLLTYNFLDGLRLTEDRTVDIWSVRSRIADLVSTTDLPKEILSQMAVAPETSLEKSLDFTWEFPTTKNLETMEEIIQEQGEAVNTSLRKMVYVRGGRAQKEYAPIPMQTLSPFEQRMLATCLALLEKHGLPAKWTVEVTTDLPDAQLGHWDRDAQTIRLARRILTNYRMTLITLIEELFHAYSQQMDFTRAFQNYFLTSVAALLLNERLDKASSNLAIFCEKSPQLLYLAEVAKVPDPDSNPVILDSSRIPF